MSIGQIIILAIGILIVILDLARGDSPFPGVRKAISFLERSLPNITTIISLIIIAIYIVYQLDVFDLDPAQLTPPFLLVIVLLLIFQIRTMVAIIPSLSRITIVENSDQGDKMVIQALEERKYEVATIIGYTCSAHDVNFWKAMLENCRSIKIIFQDPETYTSHESDYRISHKARFENVLSNLRLLIYDMEDSGLRVPDLQYVLVQHPATLRAVLIEGRIASLGWMTYFTENGASRVRGHSNPVAIVEGLFLPIATNFIKQHSDRIWSDALAIPILEKGKQE